MDLRVLSTAVVLLVISSAAPSSCATSADGSGGCLDPAGTTPAGWKLVARDDFSGSSVSDCWKASRTGRSVPLAALVTVGGGFLSLYARGAATGDLALNHAQRYGRFDVRACSYITQGSWSGIFLRPAKAASGSIGIAEAADELHVRFTLQRGKTGQSVQQIPFPGAVASGRAPFNSSAPTGPSSCRQWHTWSFVWLADRMRLSMDGLVVVNKTDPVKPFDGRMKLRLEMTHGSAGDVRSNGAPHPDSLSALYVDWVRVYSPT